MSLRGYAHRLPKLTPNLGDAKDDMLAGSAAGNTTVLLLNDKNEHLAEMADIVIKDLTELINIIKTSRTE